VGSFEQLRTYKLLIVSVVYNQVEPSATGPVIRPEKSYRMSCVLV